MLTNQCTGAPDYAGEQDNDPRANTDCTTASPQALNVRIAEFQAFLALTPGHDRGGAAAVALPPQPFDLHLDQVTGLEEGEPPRLGHPGRRAGVDDVARLEHRRLAQPQDQLGDAEDHVGRARVLTRLAVDPTAHLEHLRVGDLVEA